MEASLSDVHPILPVSTLSGPLDAPIMRTPGSGTTPEFWLNLQTDYDLRLARRAKLKTITKQVKPLPRAA